MQSTHRGLSRWVDSCCAGVEPTLRYVAFNSVGDGREDTAGSRCGILGAEHLDGSESTIAALLVGRAAEGFAHAAGVADQGARAICLTTVAVEVAGAGHLTSLVHAAEPRTHQSNALSVLGAGRCLLAKGRVVVAHETGCAIERAIARTVAAGLLVADAFILAANALAVRRRERFAI
jgi:hypothetical protein